MSGGCMSLVLMWQTALTFSQATTIYNKQNGALDSFYQQNVIWDWNWGVYYYLNTKGVSRISGSQRGLKGRIKVTLNLLIKQYSILPVRNKK